jgi:NADPH:quinone reductase-like Zn-dependent oxidoreductase
MSASGYEEIRCQKIVVRHFGGIEVLDVAEARLSAPPPGHARLKVLAIGVGFTDLMARAGDYILQRTVPFTPGYELVGEVVDYRGDGSGPDPEWVTPGTRVAVTLPKMGAYSGYVVLPSWLLVPVPHGLDSHVAATIPLDYLTAVSVLARHARVAAGDTVLIQGAGGGVGQALSQLGRLQGLRMYGTASAAGSQERLAGNDVRFIDYRRQDFEEVIREREPGGIQAVFDHIGGANLGKGYRLLAAGGVLVSYAFAGRPGHTVADTVRGAAWLKLKGLLPGKRTALCMVPRELKSDHAWYRQSLRRLLDMADDGDIRAKVGAVFALSEAAAVHGALERGEIVGKVVLTTG